MTFKLDGPDHWRYRYAARLWRSQLFLILSIAFPIVAFVAFAIGKPLILAIFLLLAALVILPMGGLGCWRCNYNLFRRYRGSDSIEHGDSWTGEPSYVGFTFCVPENCPKCGAVILTDDEPIRAGEA